MNTRFCLEIKRIILLKIFPYAIIYATKIENVFIVYDLNNWPINLLNNFMLKNCLFGANNIVKNSDKNKYAYSGYVIAFDGVGL